MAYSIARINRKKQIMSIMESGGRTLGRDRATAIITTKICMWGNGNLINDMGLARSLLGSKTGTRVNGKTICEMAKVL